MTRQSFKEYSGWPGNLAKCGMLTLQFRKLCFSLSEIVVDLDGDKEILEKFELDKSLRKGTWKSGGGDVYQSPRITDFKYYPSSTGCGYLSVYLSICLCIGVLSIVATPFNLEL